jgi:hypothetical protein
VPLTRPNAFAGFALASRGTTRNVPERALDAGCASASENRRRRLRWGAMSDPVQQATKVIESILRAAVVAQPLDPGLTWKEIQDIAASRGIGVGSFQAATTELYDLPKDEKRRVLAKTEGWGAINWGSVPVPQDIRPDVALDALVSIYEELENEMGPKAPVTLDVLRARAAPISHHDIDRAVGLLLSWGNLDRSPDGFRRRKEWHRFDVSKDRDLDLFVERMVADLRAVLPAVRDAFSRRGPGHSPSVRPTERFAQFLRKQGAVAFETWWAMTVNEMNSLLDARHTTAICVLAGALLEAALVAVAEPARNAGEWRHTFLKASPERWNLSDLIDQAKHAGTFTEPQVALAREVASMRNRIHAGRHSTNGAAPFSPPYTNTHEARQCRDHLDRLLAAILDWPPIQALQ